jgi:hypothetical protein
VAVRIEIVGEDGPKERDRERLSKQIAQHASRIFEHDVLRCNVAAWCLPTIDGVR